MRKKLIYVDSCVLITAARGDSDLAKKAVSILDDPNVIFASSIFVKLEVLPKALYNNRKDETLFYETFFANVSIWAEISPQLIQNAYEEAINKGLSALDALHVCSAKSVGIDEFVTSEKQTKSIHRSGLVNITTIA